MRIVVTGRSGQVARALAERAAGSDVEIVTLARPDVDLTDPDSVAIAIHGAAPDAIISAAAWTAVDQAEAEPAAAMRVNGTAPGRIADAARDLGVPLVHLSTDYVFDGTKAGAYVETDRPGPLQVYGATKLEGERRIAASGACHAILRTSWVYGPTGSNFVLTMLRAAEARPVLRVVADQSGAPTSALDIAETALAVARRLAERHGDPASQGVFHMTAAGEATWADFAEAIFAGARARGLPAAEVERITTAEYPRPAARPANSRLHCERLGAAYGLRLPHWRVSLESVLDRIAAERRKMQGVQGAAVEGDGRT
ncbi:dTDP-4-dehydrorhamnose reductase [Methylobrevis pamukkalensis]|uniref:dTDP-4-dehydrorhamnose reductase n=1 Tax=Methylobrevis pamukkalensis TaxID=1439726 RepID=A0A1E3GZF7_9HYPH|nr:dTDP-4-dehydrorhamnose reductase [Methylobrevis pamukkalensis]ODN69458.1 dTDP-4-dehydrorhamnose reductase [Methylobrevis pamukkalensis]